MLTFPPSAPGPRDLNGPRPPETKGALSADVNEGRSVYVAGRACVMFRGYEHNFHLFPIFVCGLDWSNLLFLAISTGHRSLQIKINSVTIITKAWVI